MSFTQRRERSSATEPFARPGPSGGRAGERRARRRNRARRRLDIAIGVLVALIALVLGPGLAVVTICAVLVLLACGTSLLVGRLRGRRPGSRRSRRLERPR